MHPIAAWEFMSCFSHRTQLRDTVFKPHLDRSQWNSCVHHESARMYVRLKRLPPSTHTPLCIYMGLTSAYSLPENTAHRVCTWNSQGAFPAGFVMWNELGPEWKIREHCSWRVESWSPTDAAAAGQISCNMGMSSRSSDVFRGAFEWGVRGTKTFSKIMKSLDIWALVKNGHTSYMYLEYSSQNEHSI